MNNIAVGALLLIVLLLSSCVKDVANGMGGTDGGNSFAGQGLKVNRTLSIEDFEGVDLKSTPNIIIKQGKKQEVVAIGQSNIIDLIKTDVINSIWEIDFTEVIKGSFDLTIEITVPSISLIKVSSTGNIKVNDFANQNSLLLEVSSAGNITLSKFEGITSALNAKFL